STGPDHTATEGFEATALFAATVSRFIERRALHPGAADDDERGGFSGSMVRNGRAEGDDVGVGNYRDVFGNSVAGDCIRPAHHYMGEIDGAFRSWGFSRGGTGAISNAIASAAREAGVEIRTKAGVDKILVKHGRATGVALTSGEEITANVVSSSVDPHL